MAREALPRLPSPFAAFAGRWLAYGNGVISSFQSRRFMAGTHENRYVGSGYGAA